MAMRVRRTLAAVAVTVALVGCGADTAADDVASAGAPTTGAPSTAGTSGSAALVGGGTIDPVALSEATPVALWFWAPG
ncbi:MAG: hypothetical protein ACKOFF_00145 [Acidimicrobiales bacterium]